MDYVTPAWIVTVLFEFISTVHVFLLSFTESQPDVAQMGTSFATAGTVMVTTIGTTVPDVNDATGQLTLFCPWFITHAKPFGPLNVAT